ncbi:hypothetical protein [Streptomyces microflavus]|uniref:hypothetical protein n=1 Tax=Streptomyces microflavus TaxID=1919 RepID=UPI003455B769
MSPFSDPDWDDDEPTFGDEAPFDGEWVEAALFQLRQSTRSPLFEQTEKPPRYNGPDDRSQSDVMRRLRPLVKAENARPRGGRL